MEYLLLLSSIIVLLCILSSKILYRYGIPTLLIFLTLGMLFGSDGLVGIEFADYRLASNLCTLALIFIMFDGGFCTNWTQAKPIAGRSVLLSTVGVVITAVSTGLFCKFVLGMNLLEGLLIGAVISSTDAASVFSILRSRKLNLKGGLASILEIESGSNDPFAYMLSVIILTLMASPGESSIISLLFTQIVFGGAVGIGLAKVSAHILKKVKFEIEGFYPIFVIAIAVLSYSASTWIGGNGYLSVYITGIIMGNSRIAHKKMLVRFFDGISWLMQIMLFFVLGLLSFPSLLPEVMFTGFAIAMFLLFVGRPLAVFSILSWFKTPIKQQIFVSWVGLRGAASAVFAIFALNYGVVLENDIFHIVFIVALFSVGLQGTLIPLVAKKLDLVDSENTVLKTFNDYQEEGGTKLLEIPISSQSPWANKTIIDANIPEAILIMMIKRKGEIVIPKGLTEILVGDILVVSGNNIEQLLEERGARIAVNG